MVGKGLVALFVVAALCVGGFIGFVVGVATSEAGREVIASMNAVERPADTKNPVTISQPGFSFMHPGNWKFDLENLDHDPAHYFYIDTPGGSYFEFTFEESGADPASEYDIAQENLDGKLYQFEDYLSGEVATPFDTYGQLKGKGMSLTGRYFGNRVTVRVFSFVQGERSVILVEHVYEMDRKLVGPGMELIERTLKID